MSNINSLTDGRKVLAITGEGGAEPPHHEFISEVEKEVEGLKIKYYMWLSRLFVLFAILSLLVMMSSALALFKLAPMVNVEPFLVIRQDNSEGIVRYEPITENMASQDLLLETFVKQYVILRNTIISDELEMYSRWLPGGMINFLSSWPVYYQFEPDAMKILEGQKLDQIREVEIIGLSRVGGKRSAVWKVDFKTYDVYPNATTPDGVLTLKERYWTASVTAYFIKERQFIGRRLINPIGFTVTRYSQSEVEIF